MDRPRLPDVLADDSTPGGPSPKLGRMLLVLVLAMLALLVLQIVLGLPGDLGAEDFLGHGRADLALMRSVAEAWDQLLLVQWGPVRATLRLAAWLYFVLDTVFLLPLYGVFLLEVARRIDAVSELRGWPQGRRAALLVAAITLLLMAVDLVENTSSLVKLGLTGMSAWLYWLYWPSALAAPLLAWRLWQRGTEGRLVLERLHRLGGFWSRMPTLLRGLAGVAMLVIIGLLVAAPFDGALGAVLAIGAASHLSKLALLAALALIFLALLLTWIYASDGPGPGRASLRRGLADIVWRTRYVLTALVLLVGMTEWHLLWRFRGGSARKWLKAKAGG